MPRRGDLFRRTPSPFLLYFPASVFFRTRRPIPQGFHPEDLAVSSRATKQSLAGLSIDTYFARRCLLIHSEKFRAHPNPSQTVEQSGHPVLRVFGPINNCLQKMPCLVLSRKADECSQARC